MLKPPEIKRSKLESDELVLIFASKFNLRRYSKGLLCGDDDGDGMVDIVCHTEYSPAQSRVLGVNAAALQPPVGRCRSTL